MPDAARATDLISVNDWRRADMSFEVTTAPEFVDTIKIGDFTITRVVEWQAPIAPAAAVFPEALVNTHVHADHVGWNTQLVDGSWVPTFPNAQYVISKSDFDFWNPFNGHPKRGSLGGIDAGLGNQNMFEDSVAPVREHGRAVHWEDTYRIDSDLTLEPFPGHTPGSSVLGLESGGERALFVGDLMHTPLQLVEPDAEACLSEDVPAAVRQRRRMLERAADTRSLVLPAHLPGPGAAEVRREGSAFAVARWAPFSSTV